MSQRSQSALYAAAADISLGMWRYRDLLPSVEPVSLGEGWTPLLRSRRHPGLYLKDESRNPNGSAADRGISLAISVARHEGVEQLSSPSVATANYAAAAGIGTTLLQGANLSAAAFLEGEMTLGYELCEHFDWHYPDAIFCPPNLIQVLSQAFDKLDLLGWLMPATPRPRLYSLAGELAIQYLDTINQSRGRLHAVTQQQITTAAADFAGHEGLLLCPEGAAAYAVYLQLAAELAPNTRTILINPALGRLAIQLPTSMPVGGIITPV